MTRIYYIIIAILLLAVIGSQYYSRIQLNNKDKEVVKWQNEAARRDTLRLITTDTSLVKKLSLQVEKIAAENKEMQKYLNKDDETIRSLNSLVAYWKAAAETLATTPGVPSVDPVTKDTIRTRTFLTKDNFRTLAGKFEIDSPWRIYITQEEFLLKLHVYNTENKDGSYSVIAKAEDPRLKITDITSEVVPYKKTWKENLFFFANVGGDMERPFTSSRNIGRVGVAAGLGLFNNRFSYNLSTTGQYLKYEYQFVNLRVF